MDYKIQEGREVVKTLDSTILVDKKDNFIERYDEFRDRFKLWDQIRAERYNC